MDVNKFFNVLNEKNWRDNITAEAQDKFDSLIQKLLENREEIINEVVSSIHELEVMKLQEDNEKLTYSSFQHWLDKLSKDYFYEFLDGEE